MAFFTALKAMVRKPFFTLAGLGRPNEDWSVIPDAGFSMPTVEAAEAADGVRIAFTFTSAPQFVLYNGVRLIEGEGYSRTGFQVVILDPEGYPIAPPAGADIRAVL
jgi:hypothetical protein